MDDSIARQEFVLDGWKWVYELFPDRLVARGVCRDEHQHFEVELKHCSDVPDRGVTTHISRYPPRLWVVTGSVLGLTALVCGGFIAGAAIPGIQLPGEPRVEDLVPLTLSLLFIEALILAGVLPPLLKKRLPQYYATFKRVSDGGPLLTLHSGLNPPEGAFEHFVAEVVEAIRRRRDAGPGPPSSHAITR